MRSIAMSDLSSYVWDAGDTKWSAPDRWRPIVEPPNRDPLPFTRRPQPGEEFGIQGGTASGISPEGEWIP